MPVKALKKQPKKPAQSKPRKAATASPTTASAATAAAPNEYVVVGASYRLVVDPLRPGFVRLQAAWPIAPCDEDDWARPRTVWVRVRRPIELQLFRQPGAFVVAHPGDRIELSLHHPDELSPVRDAVELVADSDALAPVLGFREPSPPTREPRSISLDDRLSGEDIV